MNPKGFETPRQTANLQTFMIPQIQAAFCARQEHSLLPHLRISGVLLSSLMKFLLLPARICVPKGKKKNHSSSLDGFCLRLKTNATILSAPEEAEGASTLRSPASAAGRMNPTVLLKHSCFHLKPLKLSEIPARILLPGHHLKLGP